MANRLEMDWTHCGHILGYITRYSRISRSWRGHEVFEDLHTN